MARPITKAQHVGRWGELSYRFIALSGIGWSANPITIPFWLFILISLVLWVVTWLIQKSLQPYVKARSELRAREDKLDAILNEVRNVTHVQKEIESKITGRDWNRQRAYELRRDSYIELLRTLGELAIAARELFAFAPEGKITPQPTEEFQKVDDRITACSYKLNTQHFLYRALLGDRVSSRLDEMNSNATHWNVWVKTREFEQALYDISRFAREDLFLDEVPQPPK